MKKPKKIDVKKLLPTITNNHYETIELLNKANQEILQALLIFQSTIEYWDDSECLLLNKERMIKYFSRYEKT